jgi:hypothetical protein
MRATQLLSHRSSIRARLGEALSLRYLSAFARDLGGPDGVTPPPGHDNFKLMHVFPAALRAHNLCSAVVYDREVEGCRFLRCGSGTWTRVN